MDFSGRQVVITGGSSGIGLAIAEAFARRGSGVVLLARRRSLLDEAVEQVRKSLSDSGQKVAGYCCDVADAASVSKSFAQIETDGFVPSILINSAGIVRPGRFDALDPEVFEREMRVNYLGTIHAIRALLPRLLARGEGYIVNVSSLAGRMGVYGYSSYCGSKFAVCGFSEALRAELAPRGICVSVLCPPDTDTPMLAEETPHKPPETKALAGSMPVLSAATVAEALLAGMRRRRAVIFPDRHSQWVDWFHRVAPGIFGYLVDRTLRKATDAQ